MNAKNQDSALTGWMAERRSFLKTIAATLALPAVACGDDGTSSAVGPDATGPGADAFAADAFSADVAVRDVSGDAFGYDAEIDSYDGPPLSERAETARAWLADCLAGDTEAYAAIGGAWIAAEAPGPDPDAGAYLIEDLLVEAEGSDATTCDPELLATRIRDEFAALNIVDVRGWTLAPTEVAIGVIFAWPTPS